MAPPTPPASGNNKGQKYKTETKELWYKLCKMYHENKSKYKTMKAFLEHEDSGDYVQCNNSSVNKMSRNYKDFKTGKLNAECIGLEKKQHKDGEYPLVEEGLVAELERIKAAGKPLPPKSGKRLIAKQIGDDLGKGASFKATYPWLNNTLKRRKICGDGVVANDYGGDLKVAARDSFMENGDGPTNVLGKGNVAKHNDAYIADTPGGDWVSKRYNELESQSDGDPRSAVPDAIYTGLGDVSPFEPMVDIADHTWQLDGVLQQTNEDGTTKKLNVHQAAADLQHHHAMYFPTQKYFRTIGKSVREAGGNSQSFSLLDRKFKSVQTLTGHSDVVFCCAVWNDGRNLLSGSEDDTLKVWERQSDGQYHCIQTLTGHSNYVDCCAVWNDGRHLLSGSEDKTLKVWERQSDGQYHCIQTLTEHSYSVYCCAVWNDGRHLMSGSEDKTLKVWERQSDGQYYCIQTLTEHSYSVKCCAVWNDGRHLLSGSEDETLKVWERQSDGQYHCIQTLTEHSDSVECCAVWNDGRHLLSGSYDATLKVWERQSDGQYHCIQTLTEHSNGVVCCAVWNDGRHLLSGSWDKTLKVWERQSDGQYHCIQTLEGHAGWVRCCAFFGDGPQILSGSEDDTLKVWKLETGDEDTSE